MTIDLNGASLYYEQHGQSGKPLLLLHGWGGKVESWLPVIRDFQHNHRITVLDFPGHGRSGQPPRPWNVTDYMEQTAALIRALKIEGADIMAHSFGGRVAILLAATYPELVGKLVLTGCAGLIPKKSLKSRARTALYKGLKSVYESGAAKKLLGEEKASQMRQALQEKFGSADYRALSPEMRKTFVQVVNQDLRPCLPKIRASALLIWGENDTATPLWMGKVMEKEIPDAGLVVLKDCGHFAYLDQYQNFQTISKNFLG